ncbi:hypothetical protein WJX72_009017 [[Myrmecia] bisecta]|uniref:Transthyretin/hydroxyisourate hydrolase domain-containing protein n=1 Tax=[Myrmecia] bisecta TaxID=41462 RepID=A0AAW1Q9R5_9CHLO
MPVHISREQALQSCASPEFSDSLAAASPFSSLPALVDHARHVWWQQVGVAEWLAAFAAHPKIGDVEGLRRKFGAFAELSKGEQSSVSSGTSEKVLQDLADWNCKYEAKFGHIFIICASGKSAGEMLQAVQDRYSNSPYLELSLAAQEQMKITELRLHKLLTPSHQPATGSPDAQTAERRAGRVLAHLSAAQRSSVSKRSPITSHVLDTSMGKPAAGVRVDLHRACPGSGGSVWAPVASGTTNDNGRVEDLLPPGDYVEPGNYRVTFDTATYMRACHQAFPTFFKEATFYPQAVVHFHITPDQVGEHFHIPLTWNPYGYSTYRGS